ncbi:MAG: 4-hydroxythreonine-4-phosphate dehydrogenase PdxA [Opitutaceae bacterium]|jgi:4-hydroxythreonine-4-phosphate dehydrogenase
MKKRLAITCGDPAGVGPEIVAAWLAANPSEAREVAVIGPARWLDGLPEAAEKIPVGFAEFEAEPGRPDGDGALVAWAALEKAAEGCRAGSFDGVVSGPVSKGRLASIGWNFPGQTEFFAARWGGRPVMAFCGGRLRVVLLTWHIPLRAVGAELSLENFTRTIAAADELVRADEGAGPRGGLPGSGRGPGRPAQTPVRIGVCGLNPHAGEAGLIGREEIEVINPILESLRPRFPGLSRAEPGDTVFARQLRGEFDVAVALYHDQGLAPLKTVDFDESVNVTLNLPFVRTSPDHGTAFSIAGRGQANARSFTNAVAVARNLLRLRAGGAIPGTAARAGKPK